MHLVTVFVTRCTRVQTYMLHQSMATPYKLLTHGLRLALRVAHATEPLQIRVFNSQFSEWPYGPYVLRDTGSVEQALSEAKVQTDELRSISIDDSVSKPTYPEAGSSTLVVRSSP
jgi:hypothetical protein